jgi:hypothetical protein
MRRRAAVGAALAALLAALAGACGYHATPIAGAPPEPRDTVAAGELTPRDLTGQVTAWDDAFGADSIFRPRITRFVDRSIGISLAHGGHVAVILRDQCGPYAAVPGRDLTVRLPAGEQFLPLVTPFRSSCPPNFWRPYVMVIVADLPLHGDVLEERARRAHGAEEIMDGRRDRWAAYAVYTQR